MINSKDSSQDLEYKPYYKSYAKVVKAHKPRNQEEVRHPCSVPFHVAHTQLTLHQLELTEGETVIITGSAKGTLYMGEAKVIPVHFTLRMP